MSVCTCLCDDTVCVTSCSVQIFPCESQSIGSYLITISSSGHPPTYTAMVLPAAAALPRAADQLTQAPTSPPASKLTGLCSKLFVPPTLVTAWELAPGEVVCAVEMDGVLQPAARSCTAAISQTASEMHTWVCLPSEAIAPLAGTYFLGLRKSECRTLVLIQSTTACPLLTQDQCLVSILYKSS